MTQLLIIILLISLNALFVASEFALIGSRKSRLDDLTRNKPEIRKNIKKLFGNLKLYITGIQFANTTLSVATGWYGQILISDIIHIKLRPFLSQHPLLNNTFIINFIPFILITLTSMVMGEIIPKKIAITNPEKLSIFFSGPMTGFLKIFNPIIILINRLTDFIMHSLGIKNTGFDNPFTQQELRIIISEAVKDGIIPRGLSAIIYNTLRLNKLKLTDIMIGMDTLKSFSPDDTLGYVQDKISENGYSHSRYPIFINKETNVGYINIVDLFRKTYEANRNKTLKELGLIRNPIYITRDRNVDDLLMKMLKKQNFVAILTDKNKKTKGVITISHLSRELIKK